MKKIEIVGKRRPREKHFLQEDGTFVAEMYDEDIHFLKNGRYEEIDNRLFLKNNYYVNKNNIYNINFSTQPKGYLIKVEKDDYYVEFYLNNCKQYNVEKIDSNNKLMDKIRYNEILKNIDIEYSVTSNKIKENIIIKEKNSDFDKIAFTLKTNLNIKIVDNNIIAYKDSTVIFNFDAPFIVDKQGKIYNKVSYSLMKDVDYELQLLIDREWFNDNKEFPIIIDPTITNVTDSNSVYDTYISSNSNDNFNDQDYLKVGVEKQNNVNVTNRALLKFDLPILGTGSQVIDAKLNLTSYPDLTFSYPEHVVNIHRITSDWTETGANWGNMNNNYDSSRVDGTFISRRIYYINPDDSVYLYVCTADITPLVQKWYTSTPNKGIMLKLSQETYQGDVIPTFFSKNNIATGMNPKPLLVISYRNQNGVENYMDYETHEILNGKVYHNTYNGNVTSIINIGSTKNGKNPIELNLVYNTNDVVLNKNIGYGIGNRLSLNQTIENVTIDNINYLEYTDSDGTLHYFLNDEDKYDNSNVEINTDNQNTYFDEDGLDLIIENYNDKFILKDSNGNKNQFDKYNDIGYLTQIIDSNNNTTNIYYDYTYTKITSIKDPDNQWIDLIYNNSNLIFINSPNRQVTLSFLDSNTLGSIVFPEGTLYLFHNQEYLINGFGEDDGSSILYEYYNQTPYKLKKITQYGKNNSLGKYYDIFYGFNVTTIINNDDVTRTITYNSNGNPESITNLKSNDNISDAYSYAKEYADTRYTNKYANKLLRNTIPIKYVNNLLTNTSFEDGINNFYTNDNVNIIDTAEYSNSGLKSLKLSSMVANGKVYKDFSVQKNKYYTFSGFFKTNLNNVKMALGYNNSNNEFIKVTEEKIICTEEFERKDISIFYPSTAISNLKLEIELENGGICYIDDIQLEIGQVANNYNMIENSDFSNGLSGWTLYSFDTNNYPVNNIFDVVNIANQTALRIKMYTTNDTLLSKRFNIIGNEQDEYTLTFWYKNEGLPGVTEFEEGPKNNASIDFIPVEPQGTDEGFFDVILNPNENEWQFFSYTFVAPWDFNEIEVRFYQGSNANNFYVTNINLFKNIKSVRYNYDENGKIVQVKNLNDEFNDLIYDNKNQLVKIMNPRGKIINKEYDYDVQNRIIRGFTATGLSSEIEYDNNGNAIFTKIINRGIINNISNGTYKIRSKGTNEYFHLINNNVKLFKDLHSHDYWILEKEIVDDVDYYKIKHSIITKYLRCNNDNLQLADYYNDDSFLFEIKSQDNGSFIFKNKSNQKYLKKYGNVIIFEEYNKNNDFEFYIEERAISNFLESSAQYTTDGLFEKEICTNNYEKISYNNDSTTGLLLSKAENNGLTTYYDYYNDGKLKSITTNDNVVNYQYNISNNLTKIIDNGIEYNIGYDNFDNNNLFKIGSNITLINYEYNNNNGPLKKITFGNNDVIEYEYDEFDRIKKIENMNNIYNYKYNNNNDLAKIISNTDEMKFTYDFSKRLCEYAYGEFRVRYKYDSNDNIVSKKYIFGDIENNLESTLNLDDLTTKIEFDNIEINKSYDQIGRVTESNINNQLYSNYIYDKRGKKESLLIKEFSNGINSYKYKYDKMNNITHIYCNDVLTNKYYYDIYNELIREDDYLLSQTIRYTYDKRGNILFKKYYQLNTYNQIDSIKYEYNNSDWKDLLTMYNGTLISYDSMGNTTSIGQDKTLNWTNGNQLSTYEDSNKNIVANYEYNCDGLRTAKVVNGIKTEYYLEEKKIIYEKKNNNIIYYMYDESDNLVGFKYDNVQYYYLKNNQEDIIGIVDSNYNVIANYFYDSWGKIISIKDSSNNEITNNNHIAIINPFRYRSYYYDSENEMYYMNTRYYNPKFGRFINADTIIGSNDDIFSTNLFIYVSNNPINNYDIDGHFKLPNWAKITIGLAVLTVGIIINIHAGGTLTSSLLGAAKIILASIGISVGIKVAENVIKTTVSNWGTKDLPKKIIHNSLNDIDDAVSDGIMWGGISAGTMMTSRALFEIADTSGFKFLDGKLQFLYTEPEARGGAFVQFHNKLFKFRSEIDLEHGLHYHFKWWNQSNKVYKQHRVIIKWLFGKLK